MDREIITISENGAVTIPTAPVWMTQQEMCDAYVFGCDIRKAVRAVYKNMELSKKRCVMSDKTVRFAMTCTALKW